jgi:hypothetical protein
MQQLTAVPYPARSRELAHLSALRFLRANTLAVVTLSALLLVPCFWHTHIQAGDLGSHIYNAWLAQLVERHQVSGLLVVRQWTNVLFDLVVLHGANFFGFLAAEKFAVSLVVLSFFWGGFSFINSLSGRPPWMFTPFLMVLAYGYAFHMGFMNYCLSVGLAFFALAAAWPGGAGNWLIALAIAAVALLAHPIGFALFAGVELYITVWRILPRWPQFLFPVLATISFVTLGLYFRSHENLEPSWRSQNFLQLFGQDQIYVYGHRYSVLAWVALAWGIFCAAGAFYDWIFRAATPQRAIWLAFQLYLVTFAATVCLPENFRTGLHSGWVGLLVSRLTLVTAVFGLTTLATVRLPRWSWRGAAVIAAIFFVFLFQDTRKLDRMETNARVIAATLPPGTRIVAVANAPEDWRAGFIYHSIDRACILHCFSFADYEPSSQQFRVRALPGNPVVTTSVDQSDDMSSGDYLVRQADLPLISIYQCDDSDFSRLCALPLKEGQKTEDPESPPVPLPKEDDDSDQ